ncbi:MAG: Uma2 family endonuclease [Lachnospiraceae bacterium]|nr:Uma2 family endonuclease [Lachnospiraceae bacterium]MCD7834040.1 Uma2 family endonuclease [Lachnospiraceae bacterium]
MPLAKERIYTVEDIEALPDGQRAELIDGEIYDMAAPSPVHQFIISGLHDQISSYLASQKGKCRLLLSPFAVFLNQDDYNYVEPDLSVVCDTSKISGRGCEGAPDWVIEIVSPTTRSRDYGIKLFKYRMAGVKEYWIIDPSENRIAVYDFENESMYTAYTLSDKVPVGIYDGDLQIDFSALNI